MAEEARQSKPATQRQARRKKILESRRRVDWWNEDREERSGINPQLASSVFGRHRELRNTQSEEMIDLALSVYMYHGASAGRLLGVLGLPQLTVQGGWAAVTGPVHNITSAAIDTISALLSLNKPKATFLTAGGDWGQRQRAEAKTDFVEGLFLQNKAYQLGPDLAADAMVYGNGVAKVWCDMVDPEKPRVRYSRVQRPNLTVDVAEAIDRNPRQLYERRFTTRDQLAGLFEDGSGKTKRLDAIERAPLATGDAFFYPRADRSATQNVEVLEAWKLPDSPKRPGRHVICIQNAVLLDEDWTDEEFPFAFGFYKVPRIGFWGISLAREIRALQVSVNRLDEYISETIRRVSRGRVWVPEGSRISLTQLGNKLAAAFQYSGLRPPVIDNSDAVPNEMIEERAEKLSAWGPQIGIGPNASMGQMPIAYKSGAAQEAAMQIQDKRLNQPEDNYAEMYMEMARKGLRLVRRLVEDGHPYKVRITRNGVLEVIDFKDTASDEESDMQLAPTNFMADDPAAQIDKGVQLGQAGIFDRPQMVDSIQYPDIRAATASITAGLRNARWVVRELQRGRVPEILPETDIPTCLREVAAAHLDMQPMKGISEKVEDAFTTWQGRAYEETQKREAEAAAKAAASASAGPVSGAPPPGAPPIAAGLPAPTSQLLPTQAPRA